MGDPSLRLESGFVRDDAFNDDADGVSQLGGIRTEPPAFSLGSLPYAIHTQTHYTVS
jgi:hypothetical protein